MSLLAGLGLVLVIEGMVLALLPATWMRMLDAIRDMPLAQRRFAGLAAISAGVLILWVTGL